MIRGAREIKSECNDKKKNCYFLGFSLKEKSENSNKMEGENEILEKHFLRDKSVWQIYIQFNFH